jgi:hypothetical protein
LPCHNLGVRFRLVALIALMLAGIVGCTSSGSDGPSRTPSSSAPVSSPARSTPPPSTPPATPTVATTGPNVRPGEKPPVLTDFGKKNTPAGAITFAQFWIQALDWGYATTDSTLAKMYFLPSCTDCARFMKNFDEPRSKAQHFRGGRVSVSRTDIARDDRAHAGTTALDVTFSVAALKTLSSVGKTVSSAAAIPRLTFRTWLRWTDKGWRVAFEKQVEYR